VISVGLMPPERNSRSANWDEAALGELDPGENSESAHDEYRNQCRCGGDVGNAPWVAGGVLNYGRDGPAKYLADISRCAKSVENHCGLSMNGR